MMQRGVLIVATIAMVFVFSDTVFTSQSEFNSAKECAELHKKNQELKAELMSIRNTIHGVKSEYPYEGLGFHFGGVWRPELDNDEVEFFDFEVIGVYIGSPADQAGIRPGDLLRGVNNERFPPFSIPRQYHLEKQREAIVEASNRILENIKDMDNAIRMGADNMAYVRIRVERGILGSEGYIYRGTVLPFVLRSAVVGKEFVEDEKWSEWKHSTERRREDLGQITEDLESCESLDTSDIISLLERQITVEVGILAIRDEINNLARKHWEH